MARFLKNSLSGSIRPLKDNIERTRILRWLGRENGDIVARTIFVVNIPPIAHSRPNYFTFNNFYISLASFPLQQKKI